MPLSSMISKLFNLETILVYDNFHKKLHLLLSPTILAFIK